MVDSVKVSTDGSVQRTLGAETPVPTAGAGVSAMGVLGKDSMATKARSEVKASDSAPLPPSLSPPSPSSPAASAERITGRPYVSFSQLSCFQTCPKQFEFRYLRREQPEEFVPSSLVFGTAFHSAAAAITEADFEGVERPSVEDLVSRISGELRSSTLPIRFSKGESLETLDALARRMVAAYAESAESRIDGSVLFLEEAVRAEVDPELPPVEARCDVVYATRDGRVVIRDVKSTRSRWTREKVAESGTQLLLYREVIRRALPEHPPADSLEFCTVTKAVRPVVSLHQLDLPRSDAGQGLDPGVRAQLQGVWNSVVAGSFPARPSWQCRSCPFARRCIEGQQAAGVANDA